MRIGVMCASASSLDAILADAARAETEGFASLWLPHIFGVDAITALALAGRQTRRIELGTAVVPSYPRHPVALAQQALTAAVACDGRFTLGIGLSHKIVIEDMFGLSFERPAHHMREYLEVLTPLLRGEAVQHAGEAYRVNADLRLRDAKPTGLVVAALGPLMLGHAGRLADGTITWMTGLRTLAEHVVPTLSAAAMAAGRPEPRVVAGLPAVLTHDVTAAFHHANEALAMYPALPSYKAMLDREGSGTTPADIALIGDESALRKKLGDLESAGVTDLVASLVAPSPEDAARTRAFLSDL